MSESGERAAFEALFAQYADAVFRFARRRTFTDADADDVVADTFSIAWRRFAELPPGHELPWLYRVAGNVLANQRRSAGRQQRVRARLQSEPRLTDRPDRPEADEGLVLEVLARMPQKEQEILRLALWEQLTTEEMAVALGTTPNAVYIRLHRARERFARLFAQAEGGDR